MSKICELEEMMVSYDNELLKTIRVTTGRLF